MFFCFTATATTEIYTLSLHDALPISRLKSVGAVVRHGRAGEGEASMQLEGDTLYRMTNSAERRPAAEFAEKVHAVAGIGEDRKSTRLNSSHVEISYAVFCLKKKTNNE